MAGVRSSKTVGSTTYKYDTLSGKVMRQTWLGKAIEFIYDENNQPYAMRYRSTTNGVYNTYYYVLNVQGDVVGLLNSSGAIAAKYTYDPWGKVTVQNPNGTANTSSSFIGNINPLRYRGYYYDTETGFYYLQSRYYDPAICRFINADTYTTTDADGLLSTNMFAYCENNPVNRSDPSGKAFLGIAIGAVIGAIAGVAGQIVSDTVTSLLSGKVKVSNWQTYAGAAIGGAAGGAVLAATGNVNAANSVTGAVTTGVGLSLEKLTTKNYGKSWTEIGANALADGAIGCGLGKLKGIKGATAGRNSWSAVYKSGLTKLRSGTAARMSKKVIFKGAGASFVGGFALDVYYGVKQFAYDI